MSYSSRRKENQVRNYSHENQALDEISKEAEARLAAKRAARFQAREMRQKELSRHNSINRPATDASPLKPVKIAPQPNNEDGGGSVENDQDSGDDSSEGSSSTDVSNSNPNANSEESRRFNDLSPPIRVPLINGVNNLSPQGDLNLPNCRPDNLPQRRNSNHNNNGHNHLHYPDNHVTQAQNGHCDESSTTELLQANSVARGGELYKIAMMSNAQLSNELDSLKYQVDLLVDDFDDLELKNSQIERDKKRQHKELLLLRKDHEVATDELARAKEQIQKRDQLIQNSDMVILDVDGQLSFTSPNKPPSHNNCGADQTDHSSAPKYYRRPYAKQKGEAESENIPQVLITKSTLKILKEFAELHETPDSLDANLKKLIDARLGLEDTICDLKQQLREQVVMNERNAELLSKASTASDIERVSSPEDGKTFTNSNGFRDKETQTDDIDIKETRRKLLEYEYKLQRYEQELSTMAANLERAEANCLRQKNGREAVEASEAEIKSENRRLKRELREATQNVAELTTKVGHLERRLEKMRASRLNAVITGNS